MQSTTGMVQRGIAEAQSSGVSGVPAGTVDAVPVRALLLGERLDTRTLERDKPLGIAPLTVAIPGAVPTPQSAARMVSPLGNVAPPTITSASPAPTRQAPYVSG